MSPITTHILDIHRGKPASGVTIELEFQNQGSWQSVGRGKTDADGRLKTLIGDKSSFQSGIYRLTFDTKGYFDSIGEKTFYPSAAIVFEVVNTNEHFHVPLLLSSHGYSTYRGS